MNKAQALYTFFNAAISGVPAYPETSVPSVATGFDDDAPFPYLTYEVLDDSFDGGEHTMSVNLWDRTENELNLWNMVYELSAAIGRGGVTIPCDGGMIWLKRGTPFAQAMPDEDATIKRRYVNVTAEYLTID